MFVKSTTGLFVSFYVILELIFAVNDCEKCIEMYVYDFQAPLLQNKQENA